jgi:hypothetical protein
LKICRRIKALLWRMFRTGPCAMRWGERLIDERPEMFGRL